MATEAANYYTKLAAVIGSAVAVVTAVFGLFNSVLKELLPSVEGAAQTVSFVSLGTVVVLLALTLIIRKRLSVTSQYLWAGIGLTCLVASALVYLPFGDLVRLRVYIYPPTTTPGVTQQPHVSGAYHELGRQRATGLDTATAVFKFGGPAMVNGRQTFWTAEARAEVIGNFVRYYMAITFLMTIALFVVAIAVWRTLGEATRRPASPRGKKTVP